MDDREFAAALRDRDAILILSHLRPDGDTLGSGAALCSALRRMGKTAYLFPNPETTARYLPYVAQFFAPADFVPACVVAVDIATPDLFPQGFSGAVDLCIDHHPSNALYAGATLLHAEKSACGEAVLDVIELLTGSVTEQEANLLYIAVTTDTGCFQYANTNAATLRAAARLLELGADNRKISMDFFRKISRARMALVGQIYSGMRFFPRRPGRHRGRHACADRRRARDGGRLRRHCRSARPGGGRGRERHDPRAARRTQQDLRALESRGGFVRHLRDLRRRRPQDGLWLHARV